MYDVVVMISLALIGLLSKAAENQAISLVIFITQKTCDAPNRGRRCACFRSDFSI